MSRGMSSAASDAAHGAGGASVLLCVGLLSREGLWGPDLDVQGPRASCKKTTVATIMLMICSAISASHYLFCACDPAWLMH